MYTSEQGELLELREKAAKYNELCGLIAGWAGYGRPPAVIFAYAEEELGGET